MHAHTLAHAQISLSRRDAPQPPQMAGGVVALEVFVISVPSVCVWVCVSERERVRGRGERGRGRDMVCEVVWKFFGCASLSKS